MCCMQPFIGMAVDAALDDPSAWTPMKPTEVWRELPELGIDASSRGRVRSRRTGGLLLKLLRGDRYVYYVPIGRPWHHCVGYEAVKELMGWA